MLKICQQVPAEPVDLYQGNLLHHMGGSCHQQDHLLMQAVGLSLIWRSKCISPWP